MPTEDAELGRYNSSGNKEVTGRESSQSHSSAHLTRMTIIIPRHVVAGIRSEDANKFNEYEDKYVRMVPQHHCWMPTGDVLLGCKGGQLIKVGS